MAPPIPPVKAPSSGLLGFARARRSSRSGEASDRGQASARSGGFVDRLRTSMQLTSGGPKAPTRQSRTAGRAEVPPARSASVDSAARGTGRTTPIAGVGSASPGGSGVRRGTSSSCTSSAAHTLQGGAAPVASRNGRATPPVQARIGSSEPTGGLRATGAASPTPKSPSKAPTRDTSPVKTHKPAAARPTGSMSPPFTGLKVAITLMTRKPHRFDWYARSYGRPVPSAAAVGYGSRVLLARLLGAAPPAAAGSSLRHAPAHMLRTSRYVVLLRAARYAVLHGFPVHLRLPAHLIASACTQARWLGKLPIRASCPTLTTP